MGYPQDRDYTSGCCWEALWGQAGRKVRGEVLVPGVTISEDLAEATAEAAEQAEAGKKIMMNFEFLVMVLLSRKWNNITKKIVFAFQEFTEERMSANRTI